MSSTLKRREFIKSGFSTGAGVFMGCQLLPCLRNCYASDEKKSEQKVDFDTLSYCCLECNEEKCKLFRATKNNDSELKAEVAKEWFANANPPVDPEKLFCYGCKTEDKPKNDMIQKCDVRKCATEKKVKTCAQCADLAKCEKKLWENWPKLKEQVLEYQKNLG